MIRSRLAAARVATMLLFLASGASYATWGIHIPTIKARFGLSDAALSVAMFAVAGGAIVTLKPLGAWVARHGSGRASVLGALAFALSLAAIMLIPGFIALLPVLVLFGICNAAYDVAMNAQAATVETAYGKPIMSGFHGMFSLGGMLGAALGGTLVAGGLDPLWHCIGMAVITAAIALGSARVLLPDQPAAPASVAQRGQAQRWLLLVGGLAFLGLVGEGAMYDWSTIYMQETVQATPYWVGWGYAVFSAGMALGRFGGDALRARLGAQRLLTWSGWVGLAGILLALAWPATLPALLGFTLMGLGAANLVPIFFVAASRLDGVSPAEGIASVARLAYVGMLLGPVLIGGIAHLSSLRLALGVVAVCVASIALVGPRTLGSRLETPPR
ncbi:MFS transporter [Chitiniphilus purpureus]|uniref:MFS transporter n=1 Tax=Chitiniphilus purpureus TaxID=2981137 RepID=A0ABY6DJ03_9NEIS|nr:MFS transporter [Chitiniphilus sp. CD1]UXY14340.1 MFS transporter [Chitiniphilus sp. CD1]